jgi:NTP pyrophosphatase (non-canonical NTP hydrolase)
MPLEHDGLVKLAEESGELVQVAMKIIGFGGLGTHWDGSDLKSRLEDEIADLRAACFTVSQNLGLDEERIADRMQYKKSLFNYWHRGGTQTSLPWPENGTFSIQDVNQEKN